MFHSLHRKEGGPAAQTLPPQPSIDGALTLDLREHVQRLRHILPVINASVMALHGHDTESILTSRTWRHGQQETRA